MAFRYTLHKMFFLDNKAGQNIRSTLIILTGAHLLACVNFNRNMDNGSTVEAWGMDKWFHPKHYRVSDYLSRLGLKLDYGGERKPGAIVLFGKLE